MIALPSDLLFFLGIAGTALKISSLKNDLMLSLLSTIFIWVKSYSDKRKSCMINFYYMASVNDPYHTQLLAVCSHALHQGI